MRHKIIIIITIIIMMIIMLLTPPLGCLKGVIWCVLLVPDLIANSIYLEAVSACCRHRHNETML